MQFTTKDGSSIAYTQYGNASKQVLVLLHGNNGSSADFKHQIATYASKYRVIAVDSRGHGKSTNAAVDLTYAELASDLEELRQVLNVEQMILVGYSDGANLALRYTYDHPTFVKAMVLNAPNLTLDGLYAPIVWGACVLVRLLKMTRNWHPFFHRKYLQTQLMFEEPGVCFTDLARDTPPTLVFVGQFDFIRRPQTQQIVDNLANGYLKIVKWRTHLIMQTEPKLFAKITVEFLQEQQL